MSTESRARFRSKDITHRQYELLLEKCNDKCMICMIHVSMTVKKTLSIDHCHETGLVRGLLCSNCNSALGFAKDDPRVLMNAVVYLRQFETRKAAIPHLDNLIERQSTKRINGLIKKKRQLSGMFGLLASIDDLHKKNVLRWLKTGEIEARQADDLLAYLGMRYSRHYEITKVMLGLRKLKRKKARA